MKALLTKQQLTKMTPTMSNDQNLPLHIMCLSCGYFNLISFVLSIPT